MTDRYFSSEDISGGGGGGDSSLSGIRGPFLSLFWNFVQYSLSVICSSGQLSWICNKITANYVMACTLANSILVICRKILISPENDKLIIKNSFKEAFSPNLQTIVTK